MRRCAYYRTSLPLKQASKGVYATSLQHYGQSVSHRQGFSKIEQSALQYDWSVTSLRIASTAHLKALPFKHFWIFVARLPRNSSMVISLDGLFRFLLLICFESTKVIAEQVISKDFFRVPEVLTAILAFFGFTSAGRLILKSPPNSLWFKLASRQPLVFLYVSRMNTGI